jgi:hypothetical protein
MHADASSCPADRSRIELCEDIDMNVANGYEQLLIAATTQCTEALNQDEVAHVRSGTAIYPIMEATQYLLSAVVGRYIGILSKDVLLNTLAQIHAYVRFLPSYPAHMHAFLSMYVIS